MALFSGAALTDGTALATTPASFMVEATVEETVDEAPAAAAVEVEAEAPGPGVGGVSSFLQAVAVASATTIDP